MAWNKQRQNTAMAGMQKAFIKQKIIISDEKLEEFIADIRNKSIPTRYEGDTIIELKDCLDLGGWDEGDFNTFVYDYINMDAIEFKETYNTKK